MSTIAGVLRYVEVVGRIELELRLLRKRCFPFYEGRSACAAALLVRALARPHHL